ncbi:flavodoxin family protein [Nitrososphaera viennensis]|uniref:Flavodoxin-like domain-containing protein n=2 Tax=Nitrososphaera viennensis TaxID=1034015 RepID=A0A060HM04_9ARCH|nr:flavodoxin domain-containing protein [Nitrososphaera viennensis]AIC14611.1 hypothetical protein NVIE_004180 [Nitrososphaera viennensis EN76]UVS69575.1 flavodoxin domain-containing protein [Nitrososphaera viennensis]
MKAIVLFDTLFGNTEKIAHSVTKGLQKAGVEAECVNIRAANVEKLHEYDLLALGAPTQYFTASKSMKDFLDRMVELDLKGRCSFAFDTKLDSFMAGSGAKFIEKRLRESGLDIIRKRGSALVIGQKQKEAKKDTLSNATGKVVLKEGMENQFEAIGEELGELLQTSKRKVVGV